MFPSETAAIRDRVFLLRHLRNLDEASALAEATALRAPREDHWISITSEHVGGAPAAALLDEPGTTTPALLDADQLFWMALARRTYSGVGTAKTFEMESAPPWEGEGEVDGDEAEPIFVTMLGMTEGEREAIVQWRHQLRGPRDAGGV